MGLLRVYKEILLGKSLPRALLNSQIEGKRVSGRVIDIGCRSPRESYHRLMDLDDAELTFADITGGDGVVQLDVEKPFPIDDSIYDAALMFNLLEHVFDYRTALSETCRILRPGGRLIGAVPFMHYYHPDPDDYFRYSASALRRMFREAGFSGAEITCAGSGPFAVAAHVTLRRLTPVIRLPAAIAALGLDKAYAWRRDPGPYAMEILFEAVK